MYVIIHHTKVSLTELFTGGAIIGFQLTLESARRAIALANESLESLAFATIIKNRVNQGGILANGASFIKRWRKW
jgi:DNA adenine methylase